MIDRLYIKEYLSFKEVELEFSDNLIIFSGPSGAGKSILMEAILTLFGFKDAKALIIETSIDQNIDLETFGIEEDEPNVFKFIKSKSARYFINNQSISKKNIKIISSTFIHYLTLREFKEFENDNLLNLLDAIAGKTNINYKLIINDYKNKFHQYTELEKKLSAIAEEEKKIQELKEFAKYEITKIEEIDPKTDEYEKLTNSKKLLSKREKIENALNEASIIFDAEAKVSQALTLLEKDSTFFDEAINELKALFENEHERLNELDETNIESLLDRIEKVSSLKRKHGSIEECLVYLEKKREELEYYENIEFEKKSLQQKRDTLFAEIDKSADTLSKYRKEALIILKEKTDEYLKLLYLKEINFTLEQGALHVKGKDSVSVKLAQTDLNKVSSGELNRVRLAFMAASSEFLQSKQGILILDEIDANLSGKESMSIAEVLKKLSSNYQIFAISHQPQLSSKADMHFLVTKENDESKVTLLKEEERIQELSRMISGEEVTEEAIKFAQSLRAN